MINAFEALETVMHALYIASAMATAAWHTQAYFAELVKALPGGPWKCLPRRLAESRHPHGISRHPQPPQQHISRPERFGSQLQTCRACCRRVLRRLKNVQQIGINCQLTRYASIRERQWVSGVGSKLHRDTDLSELSLSSRKSESGVAWRYSSFSMAGGAACR